ncbi:acylphosphatase [uncultured Sphingomonas sp.]|uniref:acylphosphatase n=1 Tax=uncultured Sphingomonas sp. TaxID=158754 RepID=UPI0025F359ED|nr:acylphosphatase [uncultured Sphingomonas sp.]
MIRRRLVVTGRVQGVFFRDWTVEQARALGLDGWVRNRADGSVEMVVAGAPEMVETMTARVRQGSPASRVDDIAVSDDVSGERLDSFEKRATA